VDNEQKQALIESHRLFIDGAFGVWLQEQLSGKVDYCQTRMLQAKSWEEFTEARSDFTAAQRFYNMIVNPQQFFN